MVCKYRQEGICINDQCPAYDKECPVQELTGLCAHEELEEEICVLTPEGCAMAALNHVGYHMSERDFIEFWNEFIRLMRRDGYIYEE